MSGMHFEDMAADYAAARPPYPPALFECLRAEGVIGPGRRVLEVGAGSGAATAPMAAMGTEIVAVEPGRDLAGLLRQSVPAAEVVVAALEDVDLGSERLDSVVAATSMHWVDLATTLPRLHAALRPRGWLAVWRHRFSDESVPVTAFRTRVQAIADAARQAAADADDPRPNRSSMEELAADGWFRPVRTDRWHWTVTLDADAAGRLFRTFPGWTSQDVQAVSAAVEDLGGEVVEHYQTVLHLLRKDDAR